MKKIDYLKAIAIIFVIILHSVPKQVLNFSLAQLHIWNAVPIFIILMAFTTYISLNKNYSTIYPEKYFSRRFKRILIPLIPVLILTLALGLLLNKEIYFGLETIVAHMPLTGKGNYYITLTIFYLIISPILFNLYKKYTYKAIICSFFINALCELLAKYLFINNAYLYSAYIFRYLFLIFLGFYLFEVIINNKKLNKYIYFGFIISFIYLLLCSNENFYIPFFISTWKRQLFISAFYPIVLVYLFFMFIPEKFDFLIPIGKASYHIFLTQMVFFIVDPVRIILKAIGIPFIIIYPISIISNILICIFVGILFYKIENKLINKSKL